MLKNKGDMKMKKTKQELMKEMQVGMLAKEMLLDIADIYMNKKLTSTQDILVRFKQVMN